MDNSTPNTPELLVSFLDGELDDNASRQLESQLANDAMLRQEYDSLLATREAIRQYGLTRQVAGIHAEMMKELQAPVRQISSARRWMRYGMAAAASIILLFAAFWGYRIFSTTPEKVFASNYQPYTLNNLRGEQVGSSELMTAFNEKRYADVVRMNGTFTPREVFLRATAWLELGNAGAAIGAYESIYGLQGTSDLLRQETDFYLALAYVKNRQFDPALVKLQAIYDNKSHLYHQQVSAGLIRDVRLLRWK